MEISDRIQQANQRLKSANIHVTIERDGGKLRLRTTLPNRDGEGYKQQRIPLDISASVEGIKQAESEAHTVRRDLDAHRFNWDKYLKPKSEVSPKTIGEWLELFEVDYFDRRQKNAQSLTTWKTDYYQVFKNLPANQSLTPVLIRQVILNTEPDSKNRKRYCFCLGALARFAKIDIDVKPLAGKYNPKSVAPRNIPDDSHILGRYRKLKNPSWRWVYGMLATYGLRNHEVFRVDFDSLRSGCRILRILEGKTGTRQVWACYPEWFDDFELSVVRLPDVNLERNNAGLGNNVTHYFARHKIPFAPYNLRHAWAIRTLEFGFDISLAAQQMGHSLVVHSDLYHRWISERHHQKAYDLLMARSDRPKPPKVI